MIRPLAGFWRRLHVDRRGSVFMILGFALIPLTFAVGMGIDYARAARLQTRLNALADAAALSTVTNPMMQQPVLNAAGSAYTSWYEQANGTPGMGTPYYAGCCSVATNTSQAIDFTDGTLHVTVTDTSSPGHTRVTTVSWHAASNNSFGNLLGMQQIELTGTSTTTSKQAPNIDFYVLMDTSPSMALPTTSAGFTTLYNQTGCSFACHQNAATTSDTTVYQGTRMDYYTFAKQVGIPLRFDAQLTGVQDLANTASSVSTQNNAAYRLSISKFDKTFQNITPLTSNMATAKAGASSATLYIPYQNNYDMYNHYDNDTQTNFTSAFNGMLGIMPVMAGNGSNVAGDTPQGVMFIITDGMRDELRLNGAPEGAIDTSYCTTIKNRKIRIAILYTQYLPNSLNSTDPGTQQWVNANARPIIVPNDTLATALQSCASPGLYYQVSTNQDISSALNQLFQSAVATAHITH